MHEALAFVAGYVIVNDLSVPHASFYRPSVRFKCARRQLRDRRARGARARSRNPDALAMRVFVDGELVQRADTAQRIRPVARLLADVTDFMTLSAGDVLMLGASARRADRTRRPAHRRSRSTASAAWNTRSAPPRTTIRWSRTHEARPGGLQRCHSRGHAARHRPATGRRPRRRRRRRRLAAAVRRRHHHRARPELRRPREGAVVQGSRKSRWCSSRARAR